MFETSMEIPSIQQLVERDRRRDRPVATLACLLGLCVALVALAVAPKALASAAIAQAADQQAQDPLFP